MLDLRYARTLQVIVWDLRGTVGVSAQLGSGSHASHPIVQVRPHSHCRIGPASQSTPLACTANRRVL